MNQFTITYFLFKYLFSLSMDWSDNTP